MANPTGINESLPRVDSSDNPQVEPVDTGIQPDSPGGPAVDAILEPFDQVVGHEIETAETTQQILHDVRDQALTPSAGVAALVRALEATEAPIDGESAVDLFEQQGYVKDAPRFGEQLADETRTEEFVYTRANGRAGTMTEHDGLVQLDTLFSGIAEAVADMPASQRYNTRESLIHLVETQVGSMRDSLSFIGSKEYEEGVRGLAERWRAFLDENPDMQLCVVADVGKLDRYKVRSQRKSDDKLREDILLTFTPEELEEYGGRIIGSLEDVQYPPDKVKIVLLDDWSITGEQMRDSYKMLLEADYELVSAAQAAGNLEVNLLVAGEERLRNGIVLDEFRPEEGVLPVLAYYRSHNAPNAKLRTSGHVTGIHSSVNWDFSKTLEGIVKFGQTLGLDLPRSAALGNIIRKYNRQNRVLSLTPDGVVVNRGATRPSAATAEEQPA